MSVEPHAATSSFTARGGSSMIPSAWNPGRHVFGIGAIMLGASGLAWGDFAMFWYPVQDWMPFRQALAYLAGTAFLAGGLAVQWRRTTPAGLLTLAVLYLLAALLWMPRMINYPHLFGVWSGFAQQFCLTVAALMMYAALAPSYSTRTARAVLIGRVLFGLCIVSFGIAHFTAVPQTSAMVPTWFPFSQRFWALATGWAMLLAGLALMSGIMATLAAWLLTALLMSFGVLIWMPKIFNAPNQHIPWGGTGVTLACAGAAWMVAEVLTNHAALDTSRHTH
jgi:uncharacterized membrane protein